MLSSSCPEMLCKRDVLKNFPQFAGNTCTGVSSLIMLLTFSEIYKNIYFVEKLRTATSEYQV